MRRSRGRDTSSVLGTLKSAFHPSSYSGLLLAFNWGRDLLRGFNAIKLEAAAPPQKRRTSVITIVVLICLVGAIVYVWSGGHERTAQQAGPWPPGFSELLDCTSTVSLDGTKELELCEDRAAVSYEKLVKKNGKYQKTVGSWSFNPPPITSSASMTTPRPTQL